MPANRSTQLNKRRLENYIRTYRKRAGLSQREMGRLLAYLSEGAVSRHEQSKTQPPLLIALGYSIIFRKPVSEIFRGMRDAMEARVNEQLLKFEEELQAQDRNGTRASEIGQKLAWLSERRNVEDD